MTRGAFYLWHRTQTERILGHYVRTSPTIWLCMGNISTSFFVLSWWGLFSVNVNK